MPSATMDDFTESSFDFIIVGGGTAGMVLAARLSEDENTTVGVVEAGMSRLGDPKVDLPTGAVLLMGNPDYDWNFQSTPQKATKDRIYHVPRGKMLGGSSGINFMAYNRPVAEDLDAWSDKLGLPGWSWDDLLPYFKRSQMLEIDLPNVKDRNTKVFPLNEGFHGTSGAIHTSMSVWHMPLEESLLSALDMVSGYPRPREPYSGSHLGFYRSLWAIDRRGKPCRSYAASGYLAPILERSNLTIMTNTIVCKVLIDGNELGNKSATGVEVLRNGSTYILKANKEVILSAGSLQTPPLLELSGIGNPEILRQHNIPCILEHPDVGNNLQEKLLSAVVYELADGVMSLDTIIKDPNLIKEHQKLYAESHSGALSGSISLTGFLPYSSQVSKTELKNTINSILSPTTGDPTTPPQNPTFQQRQREIIAARTNSPQSPDIQFIFTPANFDVSLGYNNCSKLNPGPPPGYNACYSIVVSQMYPLSRGSVHITSSSPNLQSSPPAINPNFLTHQADITILAKALQFADKVFTSPTFNHQIRRRVSPPPEVNLQDLDQARKFVTDHVVSYHHSLGTCAMGTVVDERLRVKGIDGLRVVDASVLPMQVSAAIMATVYAVAEKGADLIREDWGIRI